MLVQDGFVGTVRVPADLNARHQVVIILCVSTAINVDLIAIPVDFVWLERRVVGSVSRPRLPGLAEGAVHCCVHLPGLGRFRVELHTPEPDLCRCCRHSGRREWKCKSAPCWRSCAGNHQSSRCLEKVRAGARVPRHYCKCGVSTTHPPVSAPPGPGLAGTHTLPVLQPAPWSGVLCWPCPSPQHLVKQCSITASLPFPACASFPDLNLHTFVQHTGLSPTLLLLQPLGQRLTRLVARLVHPHPGLMRLPPCKTRSTSSLKLMTL